jgi:hypothetical protein
LGDHPITRGRDNSEQVNRVQTFTGQSLKGPEGSTAFLMHWLSGLLPSPAGAQKKAG